MIPKDIVDKLEKLKRMLWNSRSQKYGIRHYYFSNKYGRDLLVSTDIENWGNSSADTYAYIAYSPELSRELGKLTFYIQFEGYSNEKCWTNETTEYEIGYIELLIKQVKRLNDLEISGNIGELEDYLVSNNKNNYY